MAQSVQNIVNDFKIKLDSVFNRSIGAVQPIPLHTQHDVSNCGERVCDGGFGQHQPMLTKCRAFISLITAGGAYPDLHENMQFNDLLDPFTFMTQGERQLFNSLTPYVIREIENVNEALCYPTSTTVDVTILTQIIMNTQSLRHLLIIIKHRAATERKVVSRGQRNTLTFHTVDCWAAAARDNGNYNHADQTEALITLICLLCEHVANPTLENTNRIYTVHMINSRHGSNDFDTYSHDPDHTSRPVYKFDAKGTGGTLSRAQRSQRCISVRINKYAFDNAVSLKFTGNSRTTTLNSQWHLPDIDELDIGFPTDFSDIQQRHRIWLSFFVPDEIKEVNHKIVNQRNSSFIKTAGPQNNHKRRERDPLPGGATGGPSRKRSNNQKYTTRPIFKDLQKVQFKPIYGKRQRYQPLYKDPVWTPSVDNNGFSTAGHRLPLPAQTVPKSEGAKSNLFPSGQWQPPKRRRLNKKKFAKLENLYGMYAHGNYAPLKKRGFAYDNTKKDWSKPFKEDTQYAKNKRIMENLNIPTAFQNLNDEFQNVTPMKHQLKAKYTGDLEIPDYNEYIDHIAEAELEAELLEGVLDGSYSLNETGTIEGFDVKT